MQWVQRLWASSIDWMQLCSYHTEIFPDSQNLLMIYTLDEILNVFTILHWVTLFWTCSTICRSFYRLVNFWKTLYDAHCSFPSGCADGGHAEGCCDRGGCRDEVRWSRVSTVTTSKGSSQSKRKKKKKMQNVPKGWTRVMTFSTFFFLPHHRFFWDMLLLSSSK